MSVRPPANIADGFRWLVEHLTQRWTFDNGTRFIIALLIIGGGFWVVARGVDTDGAKMWLGFAGIVAGWYFARTTAGPKADK